MREGKRSRKSERERSREREREREREYHGEVTSTSAQSEIFKPSHTHMSNNSICSRCKLIWSPMNC